MQLPFTAGACLAAANALALTPIAPYVRPLSPDLEVTALLSVGDRVPVTGDASRDYQMIGIPDGLGARASSDGTVTVWLNHELTQTTTSEPYVGGSLQRGAFVSQFIVDQAGVVLGGRRAFDTVYLENALVGPAAQSDNATRAFSRFCSGFLADEAVGFDRPIYLTGEESDAPATFDPRGGMAVAIFDGEAHALPRLGRLPFENVVVGHGWGKSTVVFSLEDGPSTPDSQLWMYVGQKDRRNGTSVLRRNGLDNGSLYVFRSTDASRNDEGSFTSGIVAGEWVEIPGAESMSEAQLEASADGVDAFGFLRIEDGAFHPDRKDEFAFVTTGSSYPSAAAPWNKLGRAYLLKLDHKDPLGTAFLQVIYNADAIVGGGGDIALSPDNVAFTGAELLLCEDGTSESRPVMAAKGRDGSVWRLPTTGGGWWERFDLGAAARVLELYPPGRDAVPVGPGVWETSGIIGADASFGAGSWLLDVQAHRPTGTPVVNTVEDGQLLLVRPLP